MDYSIGLYEVKGVVGDNFLGGSDIDNLISVCKFAPYESPTLVATTREATISST